MATTAIETPAARPPKPVVEVRPGRGGLSVAALREAWAFREVLLAFAVRYIKVKYKQAAVGVGWAVIQPVLAAGIFALVLGRYAHVGSDGAPYLLFALAGMVLWTYFSSAGTTAVDSLVVDQGLLRKVFFPREVIPLGAVVAGLVDLAPGIAVLLVVALLYGVTPALSWILIPVPVLIVVLALSALALALSSINVYYRDVRYAMPFVFQVGLFATPIVYPLGAIPEPWDVVWGIANPMAGAIEAMRDIVVQGDWPDPLITAGALAWATIGLVIAYAFFKFVERGFADRV